MAAFSATDAKNKFGQVLELAQREPVTIQKGERPVAVVVSQERFSALEEIERKSLENPRLERLLARSIERRKSLYEALAK